VVDRRLRATAVTVIAAPRSTTAPTPSAIQRVSASDEADATAELSFLAGAAALAVWEAFGDVGFDATSLRSGSGYTLAGPGSPGFWRAIRGRTMP
jgi:hypothetical protein